MRIGRHLPLTIFLVAAAVAISAPVASATSGCGSGAPSAMDQYCETFPTANGGPTPLDPGEGSPVAFRLPRRVFEAIVHTREHIRLLTIPAPSKHTSVTGSIPSVGSWPLLRVLVLIIVAMLLALTAVAIWRHRRTPGATPG